MVCSSYPHHARINAKDKQWIRKREAASFYVVEASGYRP
jgi:hypothetical protein